MNALVKIGHQDRAANLLAIANEVDGGVPGRPLKFDSGLWLIDGTAVDLADTYIADVDGILRGWRKWDNKKPICVLAPVHQSPTPRSDLGDLDETQWPFAFNSKDREDPWKEIFILPLLRVRDKEEISFTTSSQGGRKAITGLMRASANSDLPVPVVTLGAGSYLNRQYNRSVPTPQFHICGWSTSPTTGDCKLLTDEAVVAAFVGDEVPF
jgi:hypothetical protein